MVRISVDIDEALNLRLMAYAVKTKGKSHGVKGQVIAEIVRDFLKPQWERAASGDNATAPANEPVEAMSRSKPKKKTAPRAKIPLTEADHAYMEERWKAGKGWTEIGKGLNPVRRATVVKAAIESRIKKGELSKADRQR